MPTPPHHPADLLFSLAHGLLTCAELEAYHARLYSLIRYELCCAPFSVHTTEADSEGFPRETFRVLEEKEIKQCGDPHCLPIKEKWVGRLAAQD